MGKPRVALVAPSLRTGGGVRAVTRFLHTALSRSGEFEIDCLSIAMSSRDAASVRLIQPSTWWRGVRVVEQDWDGLPIRHVGAFLTELELQRYRPRAVLTRLLADYDLVQVVAGIPAWALVAHRAGRPIALQVATLNRFERTTRIALGAGPLGAYRALMSRHTERLDQQGLRAVDAVFVENRQMERIAAEVAGEERVVFAPPGVDVDVFAPRGPTEGPAYILNVGRLGDPRKNRSLLLRAYADVRAARKNAPRLVIAGKGRLSPPETALIESLGLGAAVSVRENVPVEELAALYRGARFFVLSSNEEGLGIVLLEAMASGLAVVSTDCGGPRTLVVPGETGFFTPVGDAAELARHMIELLDDPGRCDRLGRAGRRVVEASFSLEAAVRRYVARYHRLIHAGRGVAVDGARKGIACGPVH